MGAIRDDDSLLARASVYRNEGEINDRLHQEFSAKVQMLPILADHRRYVEEHRLGFGDAAFHYLWWLILRDLLERVMSPRLLEIGVYKGQVVSLWSLIASQLDRRISITAISPFAGNPAPKGRLGRAWKRLTSRGFRRDARVGNIYENENYLLAINKLFQEFGQDFAKVRCITGFSSEPGVIAAVSQDRFDVIYVDGDHTFEGATADIKNYSPLVTANGYLVMDDAGWYLPGSSFWKGHETVSRACEIIEPMGFRNVLNIGHNRVYRRTA
jgi:hypothetical protein